MLVGAADVVTAMLQQRGQRRHRGAAHADQMNAVATYSTAASRMRTTGVGPPTTSALTPNGSVHVGPGGVTRWKVEQHRPAKLLGEVAQHVANRRIAAGLVASGKLAEHDRRRVDEDARPAPPASASDECDTDARRCLRETARSRAADRTPTACPSTPSAASACRRQGSRSPFRRAAFRAAAASDRPRARSTSSPCETNPRRTRTAPSRSGDRSSDRESPSARAAGTASGSP